MCADPAKLMTHASCRIPFLRWSFWHMGFGMKHLLKEWQVGDGREARLAEYVVSRAGRGDAADVIRIIDEFCYNKRRGPA
jgi:catechol O-methyltransferase